MTQLVLENLHLWYSQTVHAVDDVNLTVETGEFCVLLGPSGCGKTSTLRMIAGFIQPSRGQIYLDGDRVEHLYPGDRNISMVFQSYALYPNLTVRQQLNFALRKLKLSKEEVERRIQETAEFMHLTEILNRYPQNLSAGQRQRVAVGRALIRRPLIFLMDEPLSQLDARLRIETRSNLRRLQKELGITTIYVTHDQQEAQGLADKIVVMDRGRIMQVDSPKGVYEDPSNYFVAGFIGTPPMNFAEGTLEQVNGKWCLKNPDFQFFLQSELLNHLRGEPVAGQPIILGVRPENIRILSSPDDEDLQAEVFLVEPQSNEYIVDLHFADLVFKMRQDKKELGFRPEIGQRVGMKLIQSQALIFEKESGERIA